MSRVKGRMIKALMISNVSHALLTVLCCCCHRHRLATLSLSLPCWWPGPTVTYGWSRTAPWSKGQTQPSCLHYYLKFKIKVFKIHDPKSILGGIMLSPCSSHDNLIDPWCWINPHLSNRRTRPIYNTVQSVSIGTVTHWFEFWLNTPAYWILKCLFAPRQTNYQTSEGSVVYSHSNMFCLCVESYGFLTPFWKLCLLSNTMEVNTTCVTKNIKKMCETVILVETMHSFLRIIHTAHCRFSATAHLMPSWRHSRPIKTKSLFTNFRFNLWTSRRATWP